MKRNYVLTALLMLLFIAGSSCIPVIGSIENVTTADSETSPVTVQSIPPDAKLVCLFFDDGYQNQYDIALPILLQHNFKATFSFITDYIGTGSAIWEYIDVKEIRKLSKHGMDIGSHTKTHAHLTNDLSDKQLTEELVDSKAYLEKSGFNVRTFVYPYCEWDERVLSYVKQAGYTCARGCRWGVDFYNLDSPDPDARFHIASRSIVQHDFDKFKSVVEKADNRNIVCLTYHFISDTGPESTSTPVSNFVEQMDYLKENGFTVVLLPDLIE
jgi:peptidoglycan/xylan/chitin deacetylase (PgdA/CDA1 family)